MEKNIYTCVTRGIKVEKKEIKLVGEIRVTRSEETPVALAPLAHCCIVRLATDHARRRRALKFLSTLFKKKKKKQLYCLNNPTYIYVLVRLIINLCCIPIKQQFSVTNLQFSGLILFEK